jgi:helitron helicase-like protein
MRLYQDSMAIVRHFERPSLFITITTNPDRDEITRELLTDESGVRMQTWRDHELIPASSFGKFDLAFPFSFRSIFLDITFISQPGPCWVTPVVIAWTSASNKAQGLYVVLSRTTDVCRLTILLSPDNFEVRNCGLPQLLILVRGPPQAPGLTLKILLWTNCS